MYMLHVVKNGFTREAFGKSKQPWLSFDEIGEVACGG
jgi:hypothetical protein